MLNKGEHMKFLRDFDKICCFFVFFFSSSCNWNWSLLQIYCVL